jgi:hypothetical protein
LRVSTRIRKPVIARRIPSSGVSSASPVPSAAPAITSLGKWNPTYSRGRQMKAIAWPFAHAPAGREMRHSDTAITKANTA